jgi:NAD(P)-dependent dehydrogenase (short-subunit alcohol dehydrogenase family)
MITTMNLKGKIAVVTGAGKGIGKAVALHLAKEGCDLVITSRTQSDLDRLSREIGELGRRSLAVKADVSNERDVADLFSRTAETFGRVDILVNNAGIGYFAPISRLEVRQFDEMWSTNMRGVFLCSKSAIPFMVKQQSGDIINVASLAGRNAFKGGGGYSATKWALIGFSRTLMLEVREHGIRVIAICPGSVDTDFGSRDEGTPKSGGRIPSADDIAQVIGDALRMPQHVMVSEIDVRPTNPK